MVLSGASISHDSEYQQHLLLDGEDLVSNTEASIQAGSTGSAASSPLIHAPSKSVCAHGKVGPSRVRPSSARPTSARQASARHASARPSSARSVSSSISSQCQESSRPNSAQAGQSHRSGAQHNNCQQTDFQALCDLVGSKAALRFKTVNQCFRNIDTDHSGSVDRAEMRELFFILNLPREMADRFFDLLDSDGSGDVDYGELRRIIGPHIQPGYRPPKERHCGVAKGTLDERKRELEILRLAELFGSKAAQKHRNIRECFRFFDADKDGVVTRSEVAQFVSGFGFPREMGDQFYNLLLRGKRDTGHIDFLTFTDTLGPFVQAGHQPAPQAERQPGPRTEAARRRPSSARPTVGRQATSNDEWQDWPLNASIPDENALHLSTASLPFAERRPVTSSGASTVNSDGVSSSDVFTNRRHRSQVVHSSTRGAVRLVPDPMRRPIESRTWNSDLMKGRLGSFTKDPSWCHQPMRHGIAGAGATEEFLAQAMAMMGAQIPIHPRPPSASKGKQRRPQPRRNLNSHTRNARIDSEVGSEHDAAESVDGRLSMNSSMQSDTKEPQIVHRSAHPFSGKNDLPRGKSARSPGRLFTDHRGSPIFDVSSTWGNSVQASMTFP